jgi:hypothetical protein
MYLSRKSLLPLALVVGLFGTPTVTLVHAPGAPGDVAHPPAVQLAPAERGTRLRRQIRGAQERGVLRRAAGRLRGVAKQIRAAGERLQTRRPPRDSFARGPPPLPGL